MYMNYQSCSMPLKKILQGGRTNSDGSKSETYCSHCYVIGIFQNPEIDTSEKMQSFVKAKFKTMGFPCFIASFFYERNIKT